MSKIAWVSPSGRSCLVEIGDEERAESASRHAAVAYIMSYEYDMDLRDCKMRGRWQVKGILHENPIGAQGYFFGGCSSTGFTPPEGDFGVVDPAEAIAEANKQAAIYEKTLAERQVKNKNVG